jgi:phage tail tape-measure protein
MLSNMGDQWISFKNMIMGGGLFDWMKIKLGGLLDKVNQMAADGTLQNLAKDWGEKITVFATGVWDLGNALINATSTMANLVGGGENLVLLLAGITLAPLVTAVLSLGTALVSLGAFFASTAAFAAMKVGIVALGAVLGPVGLAITAIVAGITLIATNWDRISSWGSSLFGDDADDNSTKPKPNNQGMFGNVTQSTKPLTASKPPITRTTHQPSADTTVIEKINIHASPGMDETLLTDKVIQAIKAHERQKQTRKRSLMTDTD